ncbi:hypothetical protein [Desulforamulus ferrireducens]|uniref:Thioredoxin domain-containing protein n=1 Tax=Desulforamulus ferrireducens TaxID=1833852 RepID=A0A1S6IXZ2_9FIRM|nr:hypothetical protein [Desulforamulus ferrireducens]AQS59626.1 hypothetical protein B0537_11380 [Desulforamulus ferrireducens]
MEKKYGEQLTFTWIDIAVYQESEGEQLNKTAADMKVQTAPALVLFDRKQKLVQTWMGELNQDEVSKTIEQVVK